MCGVNRQAQKERLRGPVSMDPVTKKLKFIKQMSLDINIKKLVICSSED